MCEDPGEEVEVTHDVATGQTLVGLFVSTQPAEAADTMFKGSTQSFTAPNGDVEVKYKETFILCIVL